MWTSGVETVGRTFESCLEQIRGIPHNIDKHSVLLLVNLASYLC
jgi:hypothetical protein